MYRRIFTFTFLLLFTAATAGATQWTIDKAHSSVGFSVRHLVISNVRGTFGDFTGNINFEPDKLESGVAEMTVQVASVDTDDAKRDEHLRSGDFFDAAQFPVMTFKSTKIHDVSDNEFKMTGNLSIRDVTEEVTFDCVFHGVAKDPGGNIKAGFTATAKINRQDFNVKWNRTLDAGGVVVGDEVTITLELELGMVK